MLPILTKYYLFDIFSRPNPGGTMGQRKGHRSGGKFAGSHTTVIPESEAVLDELVRLDAVTKIVLGVITSSKKSSASSQLRTKCKPLKNGVCGLEVTVSKGGSTQNFFVYVSGDHFLRKVEKVVESFTDTSAGKRGKGTRGQKKRNHVTAQNWKG